MGATLWERAARSLNRIFSLCYVYLLFCLFPILFSGWDFGSDCTSSWSLLAFCFLESESSSIFSQTLRKHAYAIFAAIFKSCKNYNF